ncbi:MAG: hypothetical protein RIG77_18570 [Cyclobacteriaceae bacterium]
MNRLCVPIRETTALLSKDRYVEISLIPIFFSFIVFLSALNE